MAVAVQVGPLTVLDRDGLRVDFAFERRPAHELLIHLTALNSLAEPMTDFLFQAAVPKTFDLQMLPPDGSVIEAQQCVRQSLRVTSPDGQSPLRMRIRLSYSVHGAPVHHQAELKDFPDSLWH
ncbi:hypothetical protein HPB47_001074 [Ixodes persulcatus]|uniref:Uncharacterized protein n=1 Tax=Ixodes persulcatus TaxID=34615 RepID=A0AC60PQ37_IXOPE|nr:hypothetical protein HPB47_001074 [Ixodes persulcatus]